MLSYTTLRNLFGTLTQNSTSANLALFDTLANIEHRYLLQKYFNNEGTYTITTIGQTNFNLASALSIGATSATLTTAWQYQSCQAIITFSDGENVNAAFTNGSAAITWQGALPGTTFSITSSLAIGATSATLSTAWAAATGTYTVQFSSGEQKSATLTNGATTMTFGALTSAAGTNFNTCTIAANSAASIGGVQFYPLPPNFSKLKDVTITVGNLQWTLKEIRTREDWDKQNVFPYYANIPSNFFIYPGGDKGGQIGIWPIPSTTGNQIKFNYKFRVPDLSIADYTTPGTASVSNGGIAVTGSGTSWTVTTNKQLESRWIQFAPTSSSTTSGDNLWYQIASVDSATGLTLYQPYQGTTITNTPAASYTIGQMPLLQEDFQDMILYKPLMHYFSSIVDNPEKYQEYKDLYDGKLEMLKEYSGSTTINVNLSPTRQGANPNLFPYKLQG